MPYREKINIYVPESVGALINNDAALFEIFKRDGCTINRNRFLTFLITGYYRMYASDCRRKYDCIRAELQDRLYDLEIENKVARNIYNKLYLPENAKHRGKNTVKISP